MDDEEDDEDSSKCDFSFIWRWAANTWWFVGDGVGVVSFSDGGVDGERQLISGQKLKYFRACTSMATLFLCNQLTR